MEDTKFSSVTRKGQITIPAEFRRKHKIHEGSKIQITDEGERLIIELVPDLLSLLANDRGKYSPQQLKKKLDESRLRWR